MEHSDLSRIARLASILTLLQSKKIITAQIIADKFGISTRTAYRDIRVLEEAGIPIVTEEGKGYSLLQGYLLSPISFTEAEANALITAEKIVAVNSDESFRKSYTDAISKIKATMRYNVKDKTELLSDRIQIRNNHWYNQTSRNLTIIQSAITNFKTIQIKYISESGEQTQRSIESLALYNTQGNWVLIAHCRLRNELRAFRLDRISSLIESGDLFTPHKFNLQDYFEECKQKYFRYSPTLDTLMSQSSDTFAISNSEMRNHNSKSTHKSKSMKIEEFYIIGIFVRTSNEPERGEKDIPALWKRFSAENIHGTIPNKINADVYGVYSDYDGDCTQPYTLTIGLKVSSIDQIPEGMHAVKVCGGNYEKFTDQGKLSENIIFNKWMEIWQTDLNREYSTDFEYYPASQFFGDELSFDIMIGVK